METRIMTLFTRTPLHVGAGNSVGAVDSPVMRERHTGFPIIPGSSIKGVLRDHLSSTDNSICDEVFGLGGDAGSFTAGHVAFGEARLLAFPVRSAKGAFAMATSPLALQRFARDAGIDLPVPAVFSEMEAMASKSITIEKGNTRHTVLEEYAFSVNDVFPEDWANQLSSLLSDAVLMAAKERFVLLSDTDLSYFVQNTCQVDQHVRIDDKTGTAKDGGLFNLEAVPSETLFYAPLAETRTLSEAGKEIINTLTEEQLIQFGGNNTTGLGFCTIKLV